MSGYSENVSIKKLLKLLILLSRGEASRRKICEELNVEQRTVYRYIKALNEGLRETLGIDDNPIVYDRLTKIYKFRENFSLPWTVALDPEELALLYSLFNFLYKTSVGFHEYIAKWKHSIAVVLDEDKSIRKVSYNPILFITSEPVIHKVDVLKKIIKSIVKQVRLKIIYKTRQGTSFHERIIEPIKLIYKEGFWYIYAYCTNVDDFRIFALDRITSIEILSSPSHIYSQKMNQMDLENKINSLSCVYFKRKTTKVKLQFFREIAEYIKRKERWHSSEQRTELEDGSLILEFEVHGFEEIKPWILSWLPYVKILEPPHFREQLRKELQEALRHLEGS